MWCVLLAFGLVRVEVSETALLEQGSLAVGDECGGGRGECTDASACAVALPRVALEGWSLPSVAWCYQGLTCCAEKRPTFPGHVKLPDGDRVPLRVHDHMTAAQVYALVDAVLRERGAELDYRLDLGPGSMSAFKVFERDGRTLEDYGLRYPHHFELEANGRIRGGIANGALPPWDFVPFVVKLQAVFDDVDPEDGQMKTYQGTCTGTLVGPYVFSAAHCFQGVKADHTVWTALAYRSPAQRLQKGDAVVVWNEGGLRKDAIVTEASGSLWGPQRIKALPVGWVGRLDGSGYTFDHVAVVPQQALRVLSIRNHDKYNDETQTHDFAILEVGGPGFVPPTPPLLDSRDTALGRPIIFAGFGEREDGESGELRTAILGTERCEHWETVSHGTVRCAASGPFSPVTTCVGDSGGPVFYNTDAMTTWAYGLTAVGPATNYVLTASNSFGYMAGCGDPAKKTGVSMIARNREFIEAVIPAHMQQAWVTWV